MLNVSFTRVPTFQNMEKVTNIMKAMDITFNLFNEGDKNDENFGGKLIKIIQILWLSSLNELIYKDIKNLESADGMIKKLEEINQEADELIFEKLIKHLRTMKPRNYMEV